MHYAGAVGDLLRQGNILKRWCNASEPIEPMLNVNNFGWTSSGWNMGLCMIQHTLSHGWGFTPWIWRLNGCALVPERFRILAGTRRLIWETIQSNYIIKIWLHKVLQSPLGFDLICRFEDRPRHISIMDGFDLQETLFQILPSRPQPRGPT